MAYRYSRRKHTEEKKNIRRAFIFLTLTVGIVLLFFFYGLPAIVKFAAFLSNLKTSSSPVEINDTTPPPPPRFEPLPSFTNQNSVEVKGITEPGIKVTIVANKKREEILTNNAGEFIYTFNLNEGENIIYATATDGSGNESQKSSISEIMHDNEPPEVVILKPEDGASFYGSRERQLVIEGETEESAIVSINSRQVVVDKDGTFQFTTTLTDGENSFSIKVQDEAGNSTENTLNVSFSS